MPRHTLLTNLEPGRNSACSLEIVGSFKHPLIEFKAVRLWAQDSKQRHALRYDIYYSGKQQENRPTEGQDPVQLKKESRVRQVVSNSVSERTHSGGGSRGFLRLLIISPRAAWQALAACGVKAQLPDSVTNCHASFDTQQQQQQQYL